MDEQADSRAGEPATVWSLSGGGACRIRGSRIGNEGMLSSGGPRIVRILGGMRSSEGEPGYGHEYDSFVDECHEAISGLKWNVKNLKNRSCPWRCSQSGTSLHRGSDARGDGQRGDGGRGRDNQTGVEVVVLGTIPNGVVRERFLR